MSGWRMGISRVRKVGCMPGVESEAVVIQRVYTAKCWIRDSLEAE